MAAAGRALAPQAAPGRRRRRSLRKGRGSCAHEHPLAAIQRATDTIIRILGER